MDKETLSEILAAAGGETVGMVLIGKVLDARKVPGGVDRKSGESYDGYKSARVMTSEGASMNVKLVDVELPKAGQVGVFVLDRVWRSATGTGAESGLYVQA